MSVYFKVNGEICPPSYVFAEPRDEEFFPLNYWQKCNSIWNYRGRKAGEAHLLVSKAVRDSIASLSPTTITIIDDDSSVNTDLPGWTVVRCEAIETRQDSTQVYYMELRDRRWIGENRFISNTYEDLDWDEYHTMDWDQVIGRLWDLLPSAAKGATTGAPSLAVTPSSHAEFLNFDGLSVWQAICQCLAAVGHFATYNPITQAYAFVAYNTTQSGLAAVISANADNLIWDGNIPSIANGALPENIDVVFNPLIPTAKELRWLRKPVVKTVASGLTGANPGTRMAIVDRQLALVDSDTILNDGQLENRLTDITPTIKGICKAFNDQSVRSYRYNITDFLCGSEVSTVVWGQHFRQGIYTQVIHAEPLEFDLPPPMEPLDSPHVLFGYVLEAEGGEGITARDEDTLGTGQVRIYRVDDEGIVSEYNEVSDGGANWDLTVFNSGGAIPKDTYVQVIREYVSGKWLVVTGGGGGAERIYFKIQEIMDEGDVTSENINERVVALVTVLGVMCSSPSVSVGDSVEVADEAMCFFVPGEDFTDRRGFATKFIVDNEVSDDPPLSECHWVVDGLCC